MALVRRYIPEILPGVEMMSGAPIFPILTFIIIIIILNGKSRGELSQEGISQGSPLSVLHPVKLTLCMCYLVKRSILETTELDS